MGPHNSLELQIHPIQILIIRVIVIITFWAWGKLDYPACYKASPISRVSGWLSRNKMQFSHSNILKYIQSLSVHVYYSQLTFVFNWTKQRRNETLPLTGRNPKQNHAEIGDPPADGCLGNRRAVGRHRKRRRIDMKNILLAVDIFQGCTTCVVACSLRMCVSPREQPFLDLTVSVAADGKCVGFLAATSRSDH